MVKRANGFTYHAERPNATSFVEQKWGWTGLKPGALSALPSLPVHLAEQAGSISGFFITCAAPSPCTLPQGTGLSWSLILVPTQMPRRWWWMQRKRKPQPTSG